MEMFVKSSSVTIGVVCDKEELPERAGRRRSLSSYGPIGFCTHGFFVCTNGSGL